MPALVISPESVQAIFDAVGKYVTEEEEKDLIL